MAVRRHKAVQAARDLLASAQVDGPPVPVDELAADLGIDVVYELYQGDTSGLLLHAPDGAKTIGVNTFHPRTRQRFTVAHELGHALLHLTKAPVGKPDVVIDKPREVLFRDRVASTASDSKEIEANAFAAELLMPETMVEEAFRLRVAEAPTDTAEELVGPLSALFEVSPQAMSYRLINLDLIDPA